MHAADASVVLNSAIASDGHICESSSGCAHIIRPIEAASLHPRIVIVYKHRKVARKQAAAEQTAHARGNSLGCAYSAIASALAATAQLMVQLSTERKPCLAALQHVRVAFAHKHQSHVRKQAVAAQKARARGNALVVLNSAIASDGHTCESSGSCANSMQRAGQRRCTHAS